MKREKALSPQPIKTALFELHRQWGGKMVDFAGYTLPLSYNDGGLLAEHLHTRKHASLFDVSHMGQFMLTRAATDRLATLLPADLTAIPKGGSKYTLLTSSDGGVLDDCIVANDGERGWFIVVNAARKHADMIHLCAALNAPADLCEYTDRALLALQGPAAADIVGTLVPAAATLSFMQSVWTTINGSECRIARCGYTGEDGFEISVAATEAPALATALTAEAAVKPAGLGARDSLRLEAGLCLYGHELDEDITPIEAGLAWTIPASRRHPNGYPGAAIIHRQLQDGAPRRLVGLLPQGKTPVRRGAKLFTGAKPVGIVTSGVYSPTLAAPIAVALIDAADADTPTWEAEVRGKRIDCHATPLPFVRHRYVKIKKNS